VAGFVTEGNNPATYSMTSSSWEAFNKKRHLDSVKPSEWVAPAAASSNHPAPFFGLRQRGTGEQQDPFQRAVLMRREMSASIHAHR